MKRIFKIVGGVLVALVAWIGLYLAAAFLCSRVTVNGDHKAKDEVTIYILTNGVHTDIVVPVRNEIMDWSREVRYENTGLSDTGYAYLAMGWGDKGFYLETPNWSDLKASVAFRAVSGLSTTAIHATFYRQMEEGVRCRRIEISKVEYKDLVSYLSTAFQKDGNGHFMNIKTSANYGNADAFYEATGHYNLFCTCNTWANRALKASGQKCCLWTIFDTGIFQKYEK